jgi:hypothetical protein
VDARKWVDGIILRLLFSRTGSSLDPWRWWHLGLLVLRHPDKSVASGLKRESSPVAPFQEDP